MRCVMYRCYNKIFHLLPVLFESVVVEISLTLSVEVRLIKGRFMFEKVVISNARSHT
jgi:hypothetical protein